MRAYGNYSYRIADPKVFHAMVSGTREFYTVEDLATRLRARSAGVLRYQS